jgi:hypothetical protein
MTVNGNEISIGVAKSTKKFRDTSDIALRRPGTAEVAGCLLFLTSDLF